MTGSAAASGDPAMVRTGNVGRELAAARADLMSVAATHRWPPVGVPVAARNQRLKPAVHNAGTYWKWGFIAFASQIGVADGTTGIAVLRGAGTGHMAGARRRGRDARAAAIGARHEGAT